MRSLKRFSGNMVQLLLSFLELTKLIDEEIRSSETAQFYCAVTVNEDAVTFDVPTNPYKREK